MNNKIHKNNSTLTEEQKYAIEWCYRTSVTYIEKASQVVSQHEFQQDIIVDGVNISKEITSLLGVMY